MSRIYTVVFENVTVSAAQDLFSVNPADDKPVKIRGLRLSQVSELGDAAEENLRVVVRRGFTTVGSGGGAFTPTPLDPADAAAGASCRINDTTPAGTGTGTILDPLGWNIRMSPFETWYPDPEFSPKTVQGSFITVTLLSTPADAISMSGTLFIEEE